MLMALMFVFFYHRMEYHGEEIKFAGPGLNPNDFVPPAQGGNVSYRLWNLWDKEKPNSNIRRVVVTADLKIAPKRTDFFNM